MYMCF